MLSSMFVSLRFFSIFILFIWHISVLMGILVHAVGHKEYL